MAVDKKTKQNNKNFFNGLPINNYKNQMAKIAELYEQIGKDVINLNNKKALVESSEFLKAGKKLYLEMGKLYG